MAGKRKRRRRKGAPKPLVTTDRKKYRQWTKESMAGAMKSYLDGKMGMNRAADQYGVPRTTLKDRLSGRVTSGTNPGPVPYLTREEEDELVKHLLTCADIGC